MLRLKCPSPSRWLVAAQSNVEELLLDHAHCEKKAASAAMNLVFAYVDRAELVRALSEIVVEELEHFRMCLDLIEARGIRWRRLRPSAYGQRLSELVRREEPGRAVDRLLVAGLIEARSCERFGLLRDHLADRELAEFYAGLYASEARHHGTYVRLAALFADSQAVAERLDELAAAEAELIAAGEPLVRMHG